MDLSDNRIKQYERELERRSNYIKELECALKSFLWLERDYTHGRNDASKKLKVSIDEAKRLLNIQVNRKGKP